MNAKGKNTGKRQALSAARLTAVQALYEMDLAGTPPDPVLREFFKDRWSDANSAGDEEKDGGDFAEPDGFLLAALVRGVTERRAELDGMISPVLRGGRTPERLQAVLRSILRAGAFELSVLENVPPRVVITEYVDVAHAFFEGGEPALVNGVLDRLAHTLRTGEMDKPKGASDEEKTPETQ